MWGSPGDRIRRSDDFTETPDTMWDQPGEDRIRRSMELMRIPDALEISPEDLFGAPFLWLKEGGRID